MSDSLAASDSVTLGPMAKFLAADELNFTPGERSMVCFISTDTVDREGDVVVAEGIDFKSEYLSLNPAVMCIHDLQKFPVGSCADSKGGWIKLKKNRGFTGLVAKLAFDTDEFSDYVYGKYKRDFARGTSIGFRPPDDLKPGEWGPPTAEEIKARPDWAKADRIIRRCVMHEFSLCPIGMNPLALTAAVSKSMPVTEAEKRMLESLAKDAADGDPEPSGVIDDDDIKAAIASACEAHGVESGHWHSEKLAAHAAHDGDDAVELKEALGAIDGVESATVSAEGPEGEGWEKCWPMAKSAGAGETKAVVMTDDEIKGLVARWRDETGRDALPEAIRQIRDAILADDSIRAALKSMTESSGESGGYATTPDEEPSTPIKAGDYVEWGRGRKGGCGRVLSVHKAGRVPGVAEEVEGTEDDPAARVKCYAKAESGRWRPAEKVMGHRCAELSLVPHEMDEFDEDEPDTKPAPKALGPEFRPLPDLPAGARVKTPEQARAEKVAEAAEILREVEARVWGEI